jgi:hypothetical protein
MSIRKTHRPKKRQLGQFMTPLALARRVLGGLVFKRTDKVLEPSMGDGAFVVALIEKFLPLYDGPLPQRLDHILRENIYGVEIDPEMLAAGLARITATWGHLPVNHNFVQGDFLLTHFSRQGGQTCLRRGGLATDVQFDYIIGNPPFGGTIEPCHQDQLDALYGFRDGEKIKKETYSFFIVKSLDMLAEKGQLLFICSDTFLTIKTMRGLRRLLMKEGQVSLADLGEFSDETSQPMVLFQFVRGGSADGVSVNGQPVSRKHIDLTENFSWRINGDLAKYFGGPLLGDSMIASSGMTIGKNEYFVREIWGGRITEPYDFQFHQEPITVAGELERARLGHLSAAKLAQIKKVEASGSTRRSVRVVERSHPLTIRLPHPDYCHYNKAASAILYSPPTHVVFWKDEGDALLTFKKTGNWYLHGVGGQPYFKREGLTWQLIAQKLNMRYLPPGYILDSGAPCAFLRPKIAEDELFFILGWTLTPLCTHLLKEVINHTMNIQSKDFERLPYPFWVPKSAKPRIVAAVKALLEEAKNGRVFTRKSSEVQALADEFDFSEQAAPNRRQRSRQFPLFADTALSK